MKEVKNIIRKSLGYPNQPLLGPNIFVLKACGLFKSKYKFLNFINFINNYCLIILGVTQFIDLSYIANQSTDVNVLITNLRYTCVGIVTIIKSKTFIEWNDKWKIVFEYITQVDLEERKDSDNFRKNIVNGYTRYTRILTLGYCTMTIGTAIGAAFSPLIKYKFTPNYGEKLKEGLLPFPHIVSVWVPFDKNTSPGCWILLGFHICTILYAAVVIAIFDVTMLVIMNFFEKKLHLIQHKCSTIYLKHEEISDKEFLDRIKKCHFEHNQYVKYARLFNSLLSPVLFFYVLLCSLFLCTSIFQLSVEMSRVEKTMNFEFLLFGLIQLYMCCLHSNDVYYKSLEVSYGPYYCDWWLLDVRRRRMVLLLSGKLRKTVVFTAGPFTDLKISTFIGILKGAYSYYTLLRD